jgi:hypothetical protein
MQAPHQRHQHTRQRVERPPRTCFHKISTVSTSRATAPQLPFGQAKDAKQTTRRCPGGDDAQVEGIRADVATAIAIGSTYGVSTLLRLGLLALRKGRICGAVPLV